MTTPLPDGATTLQHARFAVMCAMAATDDPRCLRWGRQFLTHGIGTDELRLRGIVERECKTWAAEHALKAVALLSAADRIRHHAGVTGMAAKAVNPAIDLDQLAREAMGV